MTPKAALKHYFGYDQFRDGQAEIVDAVLEGRDVLAVRPTGSGKTVCFQLPAMMMKGVTFVVSPLISLMQDQVEEVDGTPVTATLLNSQITKKEYRQRIKDIERGKYKIVYLAPERLTQDKFLFWLRNLPIAMVVVDEAHCVSQWGSDFRFAYSGIGHALDRLASIRKGKIQRMALSASVTEEVQSDIRTKLNLFHPQIFIGGFHRPNLRYRALFCATNDGRRYHLERFLKRLESGAAIVYCISVKEVERVHAQLLTSGFSVTLYHGRLKASEREEYQQQWMDGRREIIVATNAFGMGINKPDVRLVIHVGYPSSPEDYIQEAGRAGRDGFNSDCIVLWAKQDTMIQHMLLSGRFPTQELLAWTFARLHNRPEDKRLLPVSVSDWAHQAPYEASPSVIEQSLKFLEQQNILTLKRGPRPGLLGVASYNPDARFDYGLVSARHAQAEKRLRQMKQYLEAVECRALQLVRHFDSETQLEPCGACDNCIAANSEIDGLSSLEMTALHLVHATKQRFGRAKIRLTLDGIRDPKVLASKLHLYQGFGACKEEATKASSLIQQMLTKRLLRLTVEPKYPALALTDLGYRLLREHYGDYTEVARQKSEAPLSQDSQGTSKVLQALLNLRSEIAGAYDIPAEQLWSRKEAEIISEGYSEDDPDTIIGQVLGSDRAIQYGFRIVDCLSASSQKKPGQ
ncbi:RecQ family ATP-dependent DNA helicase [Marinobacter shengliensis]|uniref:RecQ family ATP-dependent DNA helicase n=1 Tax=Marinobacter shengliensis TaxID=1389223 RepID=UPI001109D7AA|nr:ATP-dependent DNA helicase RecQ [Marinobacter shengliensis]